MHKRQQTKEIKIGSLGIGGKNPIRVQSMTNTDTRNVNATVDQIKSLHRAGCELVRLAVLDEEAALALKSIKSKSPVPLVADIHFDHRLALMAIENGINGLRINPGNIGSKRKVDKVVNAAKAHNIPIRIGVNAGSLEKRLLRKYHGPTPEAMVESALNHVQLLEERNFDLIKISLKSSSVPRTIAAYELLSQRCKYPLHIGITEAGTLLRGTVKSAVGLGILLAKGLGDTLRVSLTADPVQEVKVAWQILRSLDLRSRGPEIISCPTCGRTEIDLIGLASAVEDYLQERTESFTVAVMGCVVNGPGEAREADIGIAGGRDSGLIFVKGQIVQKIKGQNNLLPAFLSYIDQYLADHFPSPKSASQSSESV